MGQRLVLAAGLLAFAALPTFAAPIGFSECPAVGADTSGCELLITITAVTGIPHYGNVATAFTVTASSPDLGSYDAGDGTLIGVLNDTSGPVNEVWFTVAPGSGTFAFNGEGACKGTGSPLADIYSPAPLASQCLDGQYATTDAMDYASVGVTFLSFNLADAGIIVGEPSGILAPGASAWLSLPGDISASGITVAAPPIATPGPPSACLLGAGILALGLFSLRKASVDPS